MFFIILLFIFALLNFSTVIDRIRANYLAWFMKGPFALPLIGNGLLALNKSPEGTVFSVIQ